MKITADTTIGELAFELARMGIVSTAVTIMPHGTRTADNAVTVMMAHVNNGGDAVIVFGATIAESLEKARAIVEGHIVGELAGATRSSCKECGRVEDDTSTITHTEECSVPFEVKTWSPVTESP